MEMNVVRRAALLLPVLLVLGGCATDRSVLSLAVPTATTVGDKVAVIESVSDQRHFEADPDDPSTPSLKKGAKYALDAEARKAAIARKRNGYGHAIGDIVLAPPQTVETITRQLVANGLQERGYRIVDAASAPSDALRVKVAIEEFWSWLTPGFWAVDMEAKLRTLLQCGGTDRQVEVAAYAKKSAPTGRDGNYQEAYERAFQDYQQKQDAALHAAGL